MRNILGLLAVALLAVAPARAQVGPGPAMGGATPFVSVAACAPGNDQYAMVLLHMDGANGGTYFPDVNAGGISALWTASGTATTSTANFKFGTASYQGGASSTYIQSNQNSPYNPGSSDFTIDFWIRGNPANASTAQYLAGFGNPNLTADLAWLVLYDSNKIIRFNVQSSAGPTYVAITAATSIIDGSWHYLEFNRSGSTLNIFIDGVNSVTSSTSPSGSVRSGSYSLRVGTGSTSGVTTSFINNIDEFRYSVGIARHTSNYTPPTQPYCGDLGMLLVLALVVFRPRVAKMHP